MMKTKIGISAGVLGALLYFSGLMSYGFVALILLAGYVLLREQNQWLRYVAVKAIAIYLAFSVLSITIGLLPDVLDFFESIAIMFNGSFTYYTVTKIMSVLQTALSLGRTVLLLMLGFRAFRQGDVMLGGFDAKIRSILVKNEN